LIGLDHLAFLIILLFSAIHSAKNNVKLKSKKIELALLYKRILVFVSAFTLAHTITLISASLSWIVLPSWFVESIIAASVAWGAFWLMFKFKPMKASTVFNFGLIHGLGFASVLADLTGDVSANIELLLGFNLGVEIGQIIFLLFSLAVIYWPLQMFGYKNLTRAVCFPILFIALIWVFERLLGNPMF